MTVATYDLKQVVLLPEGADESSAVYFTVDSIGEADDSLLAVPDLSAYTKRIILSDLFSNIGRTGHCGLPAFLHFQQSVVQYDGKEVQISLKFVRKIVLNPLTKSSKGYKLYLALEKKEC